jgi:choice-of-anchor B domain-containing protein
MGPLAAQAQTTPDGSESAMFGFARSLAVDGETVFAGEAQTPHTPGRVFLYTASDDGSWTETGRLQAADGEVGDGFGSSIAVDGSTLVVGASSSGAAYVFTRDGGSWAQAARLTPSDSLEGFGTSLALEGDRLVVSGASRRGTGGAVVFARQGDGSWTQTATLVGDDVRPGERFGVTVEMHGDHVFVGAPGKDGGSVYAFAHRSDAPQDSAWTQTQSMTAPTSGATGFGSSLAMAGERLLVGAPRAMRETGAVFTYRLQQGSGESGDASWTQEGQLLPFDGTSGHSFGDAIAFDGSGVWVGASEAGNYAGALYRFTWNAEQEAWTGTERIGHDDAGKDTQLGASLAATENLVATGLSGADYGAGRLAVYTRSEDGSTWTASPALAPDTSSDLEAITGKEHECTDGSIEGFDCKGVDMMSFLPVSEIGGSRGVQINDVWGWTDPETGKEYALVGRVNGTSFVDVTNPTNPVYVGDLPMHEGSRAQVWRDIKVYENHAFVVADNAGEHGMQVFDLTQLRDVEPGEMPVTFEETAHYDKIHSAHNVVINTDTGYAYVVGSSGGGQTCGGGLHMVNVQNPTQPTFEGCFAHRATGRTGTGYTHDAQCVIYDGPDEQYQGREICFGANETALSIADVTNKDNPKAISTGSYPDHAYVHQGWLTEDHRYFYLNDELDEINGLADSTRTLVWDVSDLDDPQLVKEFFLSEPSTDHNLYVKGETMYQSNYVSGLRVVDVSDPASPKEVGHFDTVPFGDNGAGFGGSWSNYPYFESGTIVVTSMQEGLFLLKKSKQEL